VTRSRLSSGYACYHSVKNFAFLYPIYKRRSIISYCLKWECFSLRRKNTDWRWILSSCAMWHCAVWYIFMDHSKEHAASLQSRRANLLFWRWRQMAAIFILKTSNMIDIWCLRVMWQDILLWETKKQSEQNDGIRKKNFLLLLLLLA
jgi:hypothetical protein